jgi:hypothetical protein
MVSYGKTQKILNDIFDIPISIGTIVNQVSEFAEKAQPVLNEIPLKLQEEAVLHFDETGDNVNGETQWLHTASSGGATYVTVHPKRGQIGMDDNGVLGGFSGVAALIVGRRILSMRIVLMHCVMRICYVSYKVWLRMWVRVGRFG